MKTVLVIGGTGPTGPFVVNGLIDRGYTVTILHSGQHEAAFKQEIEHIHADVHFTETLSEAIHSRTWDLVIVAYGRLRMACDALRGHTTRVIALGGSTGALASAEDPRWGLMGPASNLDEDAALQETNPARNKLGYQMAQAEAALFERHREGHFAATLIAFPILYGPRQPGPHDWCIVRRVLDGRKHFIIADGGIKIEARAYAENAAHAVLMAVDQPDISAGKRYVMSDDNLYTMRQRIETIARYMGHTFEFVDMPFERAVPCHILWRRMRANRFRDTCRIRQELGYRDVVSAPDALKRSVDWLLANRPSPGGEAERQLGDPFDYPREDQLIEQWTATVRNLPAPDYPLLAASHIYRHPARPNETWQEGVDGRREATP